jgi:hypothetical protein
VRRGIDRRLNLAEIGRKIGQMPTMHDEVKIRNPGISMSDEAERIRQQMQNVRKDVGADVQGIVHGARQLSDWHYYVRKYPWACVGSAFVLGFLVTPARRKLLTGDPRHILEQLRESGLLNATTAAAPLAGGGLAGKVLAVAGPILLRSASAMVARHFANANATASDKAVQAEVAGP